MEDPRAFSSKGKQASGLLSPSRVGSSISVGSREHSFSASTPTSLTRGSRKYINTRSFSTLTTKLSSSLCQLTLPVEADIKDRDTSREASQSEIADEGRETTKCECEYLSQSFSVKCNCSARSVQVTKACSTSRPSKAQLTKACSTPRPSKAQLTKACSTPRPSKADDEDFVFVNRQSTGSHQSTREYYPMGSLFKNENTEQDHANTECHCLRETKSLQKAQTRGYSLPSNLNESEVIHDTCASSSRHCNKNPNDSCGIERSFNHYTKPDGQLDSCSEVGNGNFTNQVFKWTHPDGNGQPSSSQHDMAVQTEDSTESAKPDHRPVLYTQKSLPTLTSHFRRQLSKRKSDAHGTLQPARGGSTTQEESSDDDDDDDFHSLGSSHDKRSEPCTPTSPKTRRTETNDPYQLFEVQHSPCLILTVRVLQGRNITMGFQDLYDIPDPYINLVLRSSPEGRKSTTVKEDDPNPVWNEEFTFFINFTQANVLEISLMESNSYWFDQLVGTVYYDIVNIRDMEKPQIETFVFNEVSQVDIEFKLEFDRHPTLRYSLCLSYQEKKFIKKRKEKIFEAMRKFLGEEDGPQNIEEVPTIAVIGSGGGFRAMTGYSGVFKALVESGVLSCTMYACGLSGSSWLLSTLYSHPKWPNLDMSEFLDELKHSIDKSLLRFLNASTMYSYVKFMIEKRREGQPVSFTDIFGRMVGETLLADRMETTLTDQRSKIKDGAVPMPLYTCVHVKKDVPARSFQEWVEFSPYEIGMPKYGTFMDAELFGSKFFMGKLVKQFKEQPLYFLQGIWGSAFCILFRRLLEENHRIDPTEMVREEMGDRLDEGSDDSSSDCSEDEIDDCSMDSTDSVDGESCPAQNLRNGGRSVKDDEVKHVSIPWSIYQILKPQSHDTKVTEASQGAGSGIDEVSSVPCETDREENTDPDSMETSNMITVNDSIDQSSSCDADEEDDDVDEERDVNSDDIMVEGSKETKQARDINSKQMMVDKSKETREARDINSEQMMVEGSKETQEASHLQQSSNNSDCDASDSIQGRTETSQSSSTPQSSLQGLDEKSPATENGLDLSSDRKKCVKWGTCPTSGVSMEAKERRQAYISGTSVRKSKSGSRSFWKQFLKGILESNSWELLSTRRGRAAVIHNFMRGLSLQQSYPLSPFTPVDERVEPGEEFDGIFEMHPTSVKHIYMVDAGLAFNSPYPLILRPQRAVDIILSFDFSARPSDNDPPFKELLLAEKWARLNRLPFPPIDTSVFNKDEIKELYIFRHPTDLSCPVVFHFVLVNQKFKYYKKPEIPRETKEEFEFAEFDLFTDPRAPYSTFNFTYTHSDFERLSQLTEFNTLLHISDIKEVIKEVIANKREAPPRLPVQPSDIQLLHTNSMKEQQKLQHFLSRSRNAIHTGSNLSTPFYTPTFHGEIHTNPFFAKGQSKVSQNLSNDNSSFNAQRDMRVECFCRNICRKKHLYPASLSKSEKHNGSLTAKKNAVRNSNLSPNSSNVSSIHSTPPNSAEHVQQHQQSVPPSEDDSALSQKLDFSEQLNDQKHNPVSENTALGLGNNDSGDISAEFKNTTTGNHTSPKTVSAADAHQETTRKPLLSPTLKLPGTMEFTPSDILDQDCSSSGYGSLGGKIDVGWDSTGNSEINTKSLGVNPSEPDTFSIDSTRSDSLGSDSLNEMFKIRGKTDVSWDSTNNSKTDVSWDSTNNSKTDVSWDRTSNPEINTNSLGVNPSETDTFSIDSTMSDSLGSDNSNDMFKTRGKIKKRQPPNPFFAKAYFMRSPHNSASSSKSSYDTADEADVITHDQTDNQTSSSFLQSDSAQMTEAPKLARRLGSRISRPSPLIIPSNDSQSLPEAQSSSSETSPDIFTLAPEAFKADGTPVFDSQQAKMFYESVKNKRKLFRRQNSVSSLDSISLNEHEPLSDEMYTPKQHG